MNWSYLFKHWFGTLLLSPLISEVLVHTNYANSAKSASLLDVYPVAVILGLFLSTPTYILYGFVYYFLAYQKIRTEYAKLILIAFAALGVIVTMLAMQGSWMFDIGLTYFISSILAGVFFKLNFKNSKLDS